MKYILVLHEEQGDRYIAAGDTEESIGLAAAAVVRERIRYGYWYSNQETESANFHLERNKAMSWLRSRSTHEYEGVSVQTLEILE